MAELQVARFDAQRASRAEWDRLHEYRRRRHRESHQEEPFEPDHLAEIEFSREQPREITEVLWACRQDVVAGVIRVWIPRPGSPGYDSNRGILWFDLYVLKEHRRQGVARALLPALLDLSREHGGRVLGTSADDTSGIAAVEGFGFKKKSEGRFSHLDLAAVDWTAIERWAQEGQQRSPERTLHLYPDGLPQEEWAEYCAAITALFGTIPFDDEEHGEIVVTPETMAAQDARFAESQRTMSRIVVREAGGGRITALTEMTLAAAQPEHAYQWLTAVDSSVQGNGIGRWIKSAMLLHLREHHHAVRWVLTDNASSNGPMLKINTDLGFRTYRVQSNFQIEAEDFARAVESRR